MFVKKILLLDVQNIQLLLTNFPDQNRPETVKFICSWQIYCIINSEYKGCQEISSAQVLMEKQNGTLERLKSDDPGIKIHFTFQAEMSL